MGKGAFAAERAGHYTAAVGAVLCVQATRLCRFVLHDRGERAVLPVRIAGLVLALLGALILLDVFPGL